MEWMTGCRKGLVAVEGIQEATNMIYLLLVGGPKAENPREPRKPLLPGFLWFTERFRIKGVSIVLV